MTLRQRVWHTLDVTRPHDGKDQLLHAGILGLIVLNVLAVVLESVAEVRAIWSRGFAAFEVFSVAAFSIEYLARVWSCTADPRYARPWLGRLRYMITGPALIDLIAILPSYLLVLNLDLRFVRALRLFRLTRLGKFGRYSDAGNLIIRVFRARREELMLTMTLLITFAVIAASLMYYAECDAQPEKFRSIPAAMWWSFVTITTVGYGDVYPITVLGRVICAFTMMLGIMMIAVPTGIFGAAFMEELNRQRAEKQAPRACPHCGKPVE